MLASAPVFASALTVVVLAAILVAALASVLAVGAGGMRHVVTTQAWSLASVALFALLSFALGWLPLKLGLRRLSRLEF